MINFTLINKTELFTVLLLISVLLHPICMSFAQVKYHEFIKVVTFSEEICTGVPTNVASVTKARSLIHCCSICAKKIYFKESCYAVDYLERNKMCRLILNVSYRLVNVSSNISCNLYEIIIKTVPKREVIITNITSVNKLAPVINQWIIIQQRLDGTVSFNRNWSDYKEGFGDLITNFWFGLENMYKLTITNPMLRLEVLAEGIWYNDIYKDFKVLSEADGYKIHVGGYQGNNGDVITKGYNSGTDMQDMKFSTYDQDNDLQKSASCAEMSSSGWWFQKCHSINLNGPYGDGNNFRYYLANSKRLVPITTCRMMIKMDST